MKPYEPPFLIDIQTINGFTLGMDLDGRLCVDDFGWPGHRMVDDACKREDLSEAEWDTFWDRYLLTRNKAAEKAMNDYLQRGLNG